MPSSTCWLNQYASLAIGSDDAADDDSARRAVEVVLVPRNPYTKRGPPLRSVNPANGLRSLGVQRLATKKLTMMPPSASGIERLGPLELGVGGVVVDGEADAFGRFFVPAAPLGAVLLAVGLFALGGLFGRRQDGDGLAWAIRPGIRSRHGLAPGLDPVGEVVRLDRLGPALR